MSANRLLHIAQLFVYPVKSCRGISLREVQVGPRGFLHDREFLAIDEVDGFLTQRNAPQLARVEIALDGDGLTLTAPSAGELRLPDRDLAEQKESRDPRSVTIFHDEVLADDAGDEAAQWFSQVLHRPCRLVGMGPSYSRQVPLARIPPEHRADEEPPISFTDAFPTLVTSEESLADLNTRLPGPLPMDRFRPNIVVRGAAPYDENKWNIVRAGDLVFGCAAPCLRCVITTTDQKTGERDGPEPLRTLATYRRAPEGDGVMFGQYLVHHGPGKLQVGDEVTVEF